jgi:hypothetical protein
VLIVEDIVDSGLTLSWLKTNLSSRGPASVEVFTLLRKPDALREPVHPKYVGFDIPNEFVVGFGLDYDQRYRNLRCIGTLAPQCLQRCPRLRPGSGAARLRSPDRSRTNGDDPVSALCVIRLLAGERIRTS